MSLFLVNNINERFLQIVGWSYNLTAIHVHSCWFDFCKLRNFIFEDGIIYATVIKWSAWDKKFVLVIQILEIFEILYLKENWRNSIGYILETKKSVGFWFFTTFSLFYNLVTLNDFCCKDSCMSFRHWLGRLLKISIIRLKILNYHVRGNLCLRKCKPIFVFIMIEMKDLKMTVKQKSLQNEIKLCLILKKLNSNFKITIFNSIYLQSAVRYMNSPVVIWHGRVVNPKKYGSYR